MTRIEKSIEIRASPEKVWEMLAFDIQPEWIDGLEHVKFTSEVHTPEDKYKVGASAQSNIKGEGKVDYEITESLEHEKMTFRGKGGHTSNITTFLLEPVEERTKFTYAMDYEMPWGIFGKFLDKLLAKRMSEKAMEKWLETLKSILEK